MDRYGVIYKITNIINGKVYIGQTSDINPNKRIDVHFRKVKSTDLVYRAFLKYGKENLNIEILCSTDSLDNLNYLEQFFIQYYNSVVPNGYNIKLGGEQGGKCSDELKRKIGQLAKERFLKNGSPLKGRKFSQKHLENLSKSRKGFDSEARKQARAKSHEQAKIPIKAIKIETGEEFIFKSIQECAKTLNLQGCNISRVLKGRQNRSQHKGYRFIQITLDKQGK